MDPKNHKDLLDKENVVAVAKGEKWTNGKNTGEEALLVFVEKKVPRSQLKASDIIPSMINKQKTDVVGRIGEIKSHALTQKIRPILGGYSCGHGWVTAGTLGGWFIDQDGDLVGLSNNHVLAAENRAYHIGQRTHGGGISKGHLNIQPGRYDKSQNFRSNRIGRLKSYVKLTNSNVQDAAITKVDQASLVDPEIYRIGQPAGFRDDLNIGEMVQKVGRTTEYTSAHVIATDAVVRVQFGRRLGILEFEDQIITDYMSKGGDSGSLLLDMSNNVVGLLFAGSNLVTIHNKIKYPRDEWGLQIYDPNPITESFTSTLKVDGVDDVSNTPGDLNALIARARKLARGGKSVSLNISFSAD